MADDTDSLLLLYGKHAMEILVQCNVWSLLRSKIRVSGDRTHSADRSNVSRCPDRVGKLWQGGNKYLNMRINVDIQVQISAKLVLRPTGNG